MVGGLADILDDVVGLHEWPIFFFVQIQCDIQEVNNSFVGINSDFQATSTSQTTEHSSGVNVVLYYLLQF